MTVNLISEKISEQVVKPPIGAPDLNAIPWIREIRYAVSKFGHLAKSFLATYGRDGLRNEILVALLEAAKTRPHLQDSAYRNDRKLDSYAIQIAKNLLKDLGEPKYGSEWVLNEAEGQQEKRKRQVQEIPFYDATILLSGKPTKLINYQESGSETGDAAFTSHNTIPEGEDNLADDSLPDLDDAIDSASGIARLAHIYRQLKPAYQSALILAKIYRHPKRERPALLTKFSLEPRLGLSAKGWDKRWERTKTEIRRLTAPHAVRAVEQWLEKFIGGQTGPSNFQFSNFRLNWFEAYRANVAKDTLRKFGGAWPELKSLLENGAALSDAELIAAADQIKGRHAKTDFYVGRAMTIYWASQATNYATMKTKAVKRKDGRVVVGVYARSFVDLFLEREYKLTEFRQAGYEPPCQAPQNTKKRSRKSCPKKLAESPHRSPWVGSSARTRTFLEGALVLTGLGPPALDAAYRPRAFFLKCRICQRYRATKTAAPEHVNQEIEIKAQIELTGAEDCEFYGPPDEILYACRECCKMPFLHFICAARTPAPIRKLIDDKWERILGSIRCRARRAIGCIYCFRHLKDRLEPVSPSFKPLPTLAEVEDMRILDWRQGDFAPWTTNMSPTKILLDNFVKKWGV
jgi:hypothetical protein